MKQMHGGNVLGMGEILDMSANINPLGLPERVREAVISSSSEWEKYPDPFCTELCEKIAEKLGITDQLDKYPFQNSGSNFLIKGLCSLRGQSPFLNVFFNGGDT